MTDFILFYEHRAREMESICLLKEELRRRGHSVRLANIYYWRSFTTFLFCRPRVVVVPWLYDDRDVGLYDRFPVPVTKILNLQSEQVYNQAIREKGTLYPHGAARDARHICWGEREKSYLLADGLPEENLIVTGSIPMDLNRKAFRSSFLSREELAVRYGLDPEKKWVLFISSFSYVGMSQERLEEIDQLTGVAFAFADISRRSQQEILGWFERYARSHPDAEVIYRPHPSESGSEALEKLRHSYGNFKVIGSESVRQWIYCCQSINNWFSTSLNDVCFLGKSSSTLRPYPIPPEMDNEELLLERHVTTYEAFEAYNDAGQEGPGRELLDVVGQFYRMDEQPAYQRVADLLEEMLRQEGTDFSAGKAAYRPDPPLKRLRMAVFVWLSTFIRWTPRLLEKINRPDFTGPIIKECFAIGREVKNTSRRMRDIITKECGGDYE